MKDPRTDDERLSALLDGRLDEPERQELLAHLAESDDDYEVFAEAAAILRALEEEDAPRSGPMKEPVPSTAEPAPSTAEPRPVPIEHAPTTRVIPIKRAPRPGGWRSPAVRRGAMAAIVVALALFGALSLRTRAAAAGSPVGLAERLAYAGEGLPEGWTGRPRWSLTRGDGAPGTFTPREREAQAVRAGAWMVNLAVAVRARDTLSTQTIAEQVRSRFAPRLTGAGNPFPRIAERAGAPPDSLAGLLDDATGRLAESWGREPMRVGAWIEAASLAAAQRDTAFFRGDASGDMLDDAESLAGADPEGARAVEQVRAALAREGPPEWAALSQGLDALLREIAS